MFRTAKLTCATLALLLSPAAMFAASGAAAQTAAVEGGSYATRSWQNRAANQLRRADEPAPQAQRQATPQSAAPPPATTPAAQGQTAVAPPTPPAPQPLAPAVEIEQDEDQMRAATQSALAQILGEAPKARGTADGGAASPTPAASQASAAGGDTVVVQPGDTLSIIAGRVYGNPLLYRRLYEANRDQLATPNSITEGMVLRVPR